MYYWLLFGVFVLSFALGAGISYFYFNHVHEVIDSCEFKYLRIIGILENRQKKL